MVLEQFLQAIPFDQLLIQTINGIVTGMILALVASGLTLIFGIMDVVNFAHGELFMLGAYVGVITLAATGDFWIALVVADHRRAARGGHPRDGSAPAARPPSLDHHPGHLRHLFGAAELCAGSSARWRARSRSPSPATSRSSISTILVPARDRVPLGCDHRRLWLFLKFGTYGIWIRATTQDRVMAQAMGIPVPWVLTFVFAIGAGMAAASGVLFGPLVGVNHAMGLDWVLKAFIVVVVGGMGNLWGSVAAIFISLLEAYAALWVSPAQAVIASFVVLILTLLFRPTGLFVPTPK